MYGEDQRKFYDIENLIGKDIPKLNLPESLGEAPLYEPEKKFDKPKFPGKKPFKRKPNFKPKDK